MPPPVQHPLPCVPQARDFLNELLQVAASDGTVHNKPTYAEGRWRMGFDTVKGNVRGQNEDYVLGFEVHRRQVLILADGCGGTPFGQRASFLAVREAALSVIQEYGCAPAADVPGETAVAWKALRHAAHALSREGDKLNVSEVHDGLRTTLVVVIAGERQYGIAYAGDGGGLILRASGKSENFLKPQKVNSIQNLLATSLGPTIVGEPVSLTVDRLPGDVLMAGTDGIFDRVDGTFVTAVLQTCINADGDLPEVVATVLRELTEYKDVEGYVVDDNCTFGILSDATPPRLPRGFWCISPSAASAGAGTTPTGAQTVV